MYLKRDIVVKVYKVVHLIYSKVSLRKSKEIQCSNGILNMSPFIFENFLLRKYYKIKICQSLWHNISTYIAKQNQKEI